MDVCFHSLVLCLVAGSNSHNNGNPAGDGQAGDAGEGESGTAHSPFLTDLCIYPLP